MSNVVLKINAIDETRQAFASVRQNLDGLEKTTTGLRSRIDDLQPTFQGMAAAGTAAFAAISAFSLVSIRGAAQAEVAQKRLAHVIQTSTGASDAQVAALIRQAEALEEVGVVSADAINILQEEAASFDLSAEAIERLTPAATDFTVALYGINPSAEQARQAMTGLGKALQGQLELLTKKGYQLDVNSEAILKNGTEEERVSEIIKILGSNYENLNTAMRNTAEGGMVGMSFATGKLSDSIGEALIPALNQITSTLAPLIDKIAEWIATNPELTKNILIATAAVAGLVAIVGTLGLLLPPIIAGFTLLLGPVGLAIAIIGALGFAVMRVVQILDILKNDTAMVWLGIKEYFKEAVDFIISKTLDPLIAKLESVISFLKRVRDGIAAIGGKVGGAVSSILPGRAAGGPVASNTPYIVGERGPELFVPSGAGRVVPNYALAGGSTAPVINLTITGNSFMGEDDMAERVGDRIISLVKQNMRL
ncbi:hypothetical protein ACRDNQ_04025 [Palleronia sp. KMU-117]|uniref:hypothetical protein n=1 Tax=Palleronia sp. KMU-117 TaxID=3434108 RepID=UPI003D74A2C8